MVVAVVVVVVLMVVAVVVVCEKWDKRTNYCHMFSLIIGYNGYFAYLCCVGTGMDIPGSHILPLGHIELTV